MADNKILKQLTVKGTTYDLVDAGARELIDELSKYTDYLGVTTTALTDGATTNPISINGEDVTAKKGNIANYGAKEFIFNGTAWQEFGDLSGLGELAYVDSVVATYTPAGDMTDPTVTLGGTATATAQDITVGGTATAAAQSIAVAGTATAAAQTINLTSTEKSIPNVTSVGSMPTFTVDEANGILSITDGAVPTLGDAITVNDVTAATAQASSVDLTSVTATASASSVDLTNVTATAEDSSVSIASLTATATGTAFTGTQATITSRKAQA